VAPRCHLGNYVIASKGPCAAERASSSSELAVLRINVTQGYVVAEWSRRLNCTPSQLRATAALVGNVAADIEAHHRPLYDAAKKQAALRAAFVSAPERPSE
jgi:hypothetical protein